MNYETYYIPANYTDAGRIFGLFEIRNVIEALLLGVPVLAFCLKFLPFGLTAKIILTLVIVIPAVGFAVMGINGDSLSRHMKAWLGWRKRRRVLTYRGEANYNEFERAFIRQKRQGA